VIVALPVRPLRDEVAARAWRSREAFVNSINSSIAERC